ncbi:MAG: MarR family winged helix-turn-helix transcriptional regulator [Acidimicrobiales bacterium]
MPLESLPDRQPGTRLGDRQPGTRLGDRQPGTRHGDRQPGTRHPGRTAAWLAKQVELGLAAVDLTLPQYRILWLLDYGPSVSSALADRLAVRPPSVTAVVDGLVARGLVERRHDQVDRRQVAHVLTPAGRLALEAADRAVDGRLADIASCLPSRRLADRADTGLELWQQAMLAHRERAEEDRR